MIIAVTGGHDYHLTHADHGWLDATHQQHLFTEVRDGGAPGVDTEVRTWAQTRGIWTVTYWAAWQGRGKAAGPMRNTRLLEGLKREQLLADTAIVLLCFPGGADTRDCVAQARRLHIPLLPSPSAPWLAEGAEGELPT
jgi:YspA, cpYpsA-related SLOG family